MSDGSGERLDGMVEGRQPRAHQEPGAEERRASGSSTTTTAPSARRAPRSRRRRRRRAGRRGRARPRSSNGGLLAVREPARPPPTAASSRTSSRPRGSDSRIGRGRPRRSGSTRRAGSGTMFPPTTGPSQPPTPMSRRPGSRTRRGGSPKTWTPAGRRLTGRPLERRVVLAMIKRRSRTAPQLRAAPASSWPAPTASPTRGIAKRLHLVRDHCLQVAHAIARQTGSTALRTSPGRAPHTKVTAD